MGDHLGLRPCDVADVTPGQLLAGLDYATKE